MSENKPVPPPKETTLVQQTSAQFYSGPIPPAEELAKYNDALPNGADRILSLAERQAGHRQKLESQVISNDIIRSYFGLATGFTISVLALVASTYCILNGHDTAGAMMFSATLVSIVTTFVNGIRQRQKEREEKSQ